MSWQSGPQLVFGKQFLCHHFSSKNTPASLIRGRFVLDSAPRGPSFDFGADGCARVSLSRTFFFITILGVRHRFCFFFLCPFFPVLPISYLCMPPLNQETMFFAIRSTGWVSPVPPHLPINPSPCAHFHPLTHSPCPYVLP